MPCGAEYVLLHCFNPQSYFAIVNCADIALSVFYSPVLTVTDNFAVMNWSFLAFRVGFAPVS